MKNKRFSQKSFIDVFYRFCVIRVYNKLQLDFLSTLWHLIQYIGRFLCRYKRILAKSTIKISLFLRNLKENDGGFRCNRLSDRFQCFVFDSHGLFSLQNSQISWRKLFGWSSNFDNSNGRSWSDLLHGFALVLPSR